MELYSPLCGKCVFDRLNMGTIICKKQNTQEITFTSEGYYMIPVFDNCECMIFPSKDQRDWSKFQKPFKDGDILYVDCTDEDDDKQYDYIFILNKICNGLVYSYCHYYMPNDDFEFREHGIECLTDDKYPIRLATEEEKLRLFDAIKANGYKWNSEAKTLEKLPKFKVGDRVKHISTYVSGIIVKVNDKGYYIDYPKGEGVCFISFELEKDYELTPNKFDITTLVPFESRVLVRECKKDVWQPTFYGFFHQPNKRFYTTSNTWLMCIPYNEDTKHLVGTTNDCDEFYKTWK